MKDLIAKLQMDANITLGAIWLHIDAQAARIDELEAQIASASAPADTDKLRDDNALMRAAINCGHVIMADRIVLECDPDIPGNALSQLRDRLNAAASTALQAPVREVPEPEGWREAMQEFVDRCERGEILSRYTYSKFKALLAPLPAAPVQEPKP